VEHLLAVGNVFVDGFDGAGFEAGISLDQAVDLASTMTLNIETAHKGPTTSQKKSATITHRSTSLPHQGRLQPM